MQKAVHRPLLAVLLLVCGLLLLINDNFIFNKFSRLINRKFFKLPKVNYQPGSVAVLTLLTKNIYQKYSLNVANMQSYAARHNYTMLSFNGKEKAFHNSPYLSALNMAKHWRKLLVISEGLRRHEFVLFLDADNLITMPELRIETFFENSPAQVVFSGSPCFSSSHFMMFRRGLISEDFLRRWWRHRTRFKYSCHYDQGSFIFAMMELTIELLYGNARANFEKCFRFVQKTDMKISKCDKFQGCLANVCSQWVTLLKTVSDVEGRQHLTEIQPFSLKELSKRANDLPLTWNNAHWRRSGWNTTRINLSLQKNRKHIFKNCSNSFTIHPVKSKDQFQCFKLPH